MKIANHNNTKNVIRDSDGDIDIDNDQPPRRRRCKNKRRPENTTHSAFIYSKKNGKHVYKYAVTTIGFEFEASI